MKKKRIIVIIALAVMAVIVFSVIDNGIKQVRDINRFPGLSAEYDQHILLQARDKGGCRKLTGDVIITFVFLNDSKSSWDDDSELQFRSEVVKISDLLVEQAEKYNTGLHITENFLKAQINDEVSMKSDDWKKSAIENSDLDPSFYANVSDNYETPVIFCVCRNGRAFACPSDDDNIEYAVLYQTDYDYRHELLHLFGAKDFYVEDHIKAAQKKYLPDNIMVSSSIPEIDEFTAYLIGWTDSILPNTLKFLDETISVTPEIYAIAASENTFTGYKTVINETSTYTGYLIDGCAEGQGCMTWNDGSEYNGEWKNNVKDGQGCMTWNDGSEYTGEWKNDVMEGQGRMTWINGTEYTGEWKNGIKDGQGRMTWSNGTEYVGEWKNDVIDGYGTMVYADGTEKTGYWENGEFVG